MEHIRPPRGDGKNKYRLSKKTKIRHEYSFTVIRQADYTE